MIKWWRKEDDAWWVDYIEKDLSPELERDLRVLLSHSAMDRKIVENYRKLRRVLLTLDNMKAPANKKYYDGLHTRIMAGVDSEVAVDEAAEESVRRGPNLPQIF